MSDSKQTEEERIVMASLIGQLKEMFLTTEFFEKFSDTEYAFDKFGNLKTEEKDIYKECKEKYPEISEGVDMCHIIDLLDTVEEVRDFLRSEKISETEIEQIIEKARKFTKTFLEQKKEREVELSWAKERSEQLTEPSEKMGKLLKFPRVR